MRPGDADFLTLGPEDAARLTAVFRDAAGLALGEDARFSMERKLRERVIATGTESFAGYAALLRAASPEGRRELDEALDLVTTHETYFFREDYQLTAFRREIVPSLAAQTAATRRLTAWSAGCATGEEAYSIAALLCDAPALAGWDARVIGTDLSRRGIAAARRGIYGRGSFRTSPLLSASSVVEPHDDGSRVREHLQRMCRFSQLNLLDEGRAATLGRVEAVFCRNVLIYLVPEARKAVLGVLFDRLVPGGYLMLGHSESLLGDPGPFEPVQLSDALVYRRPMTDSDPKKRAR
ncbi:MAG: protein-glutamate O-methyltransferase CheR [Polyangiaceae bacterium]|nr:protein-glutamate O-methyltransferase CheR [Polyangiaceae bacterium]